MSQTAVQVTKAIIESVSSNRDLVEIPEIRGGFINTYQNTTGATNGALKWETEKACILETLAGSPALQKCTKISMYAAIHKLAYSGLTLMDGLSYFIPKGDKVVFLPGWKGRLEQINEFPSVSFVNKPKVVYSCDEFDYTEGMKTMIKVHNPHAEPRPVGSKITHVYMVVEHKHGTEVVIMTAEKVYKARASSDTYTTYIKNKHLLAETKGDDGTMKATWEKTGSNGKYTADYKLPLWVSDEAEAFKKTIVKKYYNDTPGKLDKHKAIDKDIKGVDFDSEFDNDEFSDEEQPTQQSDTNTPPVNADSAEDEYHDFEEVKDDNKDMGTPPVRPTQDKGYNGF